MSDSLDQIRTHLSELNGTSPKGKTHLMEIMALMRSGLGELAKTESLNYDSRGIGSVIRLSDGKRYLITVSECE